MKPNEILAALLKLSPDEARQVIKEAHMVLDRKARNAIDEGTTVEFTAKGGAKIRGTVIRVNRKNIIVTASMDRYGLKTPRPVRWTVSPSLLRVVEAETK
jgi:chaperone required for assembly of F1-ATPase